MWSEGRELKVNLLVALTLVFALCIAHELGHPIVHTIIHGFGGCSITLGLMDWTTNYSIMYPWADLWVTAGGLIFTIPFLALWGRVEIPSRIVLMVLLGYGMIEILGAML